MDKKLFASLCFGALLLMGTVSSQTANAELKFSLKFGTPGSSASNLQNPNNVLVSGSGNTIYVIDTGNHRINAFEIDGDHDFKFGSFCDVDSIVACNTTSPGADNSGDGQFNNPKAAVLDSSNNLLYVADTANDRIQVINVDNEGAFDYRFGSSGSADGKLNSPEGVALDKSEDLLYVADTGNNRIQVFDIDNGGDFSLTFGSLGSGNGQFNSPRGLVFDSSNDLLYVADTGNNRIQVFKLVDSTTCPSGTTKITEKVCLFQKFGSSAGSNDGQFKSPKGLALDSSNDLLYVADTENDRIQVFKLVDSTTCPSGTTEVIDGVCFVEKFGTAGSTDGKFNSPTGLALGTSNLLYVADTDNNRIQVLTLTSSSSTPSSGTTPSPKNLKGSPISPTSIILSWDEPAISSDISPITGYKIEFKSGSTSYTTIIQDTTSTATSFIHKGLDSSKTYSYQVSAINSKGTSSPSGTSVKPGSTTVPVALIATAISRDQIRLSWQPPSDTVGQSIGGYQINRMFSTGVLVEMGETNSNITTFTVSSLTTGTTYSFVVKAKIGYGYTNESNTASATPMTNSVDRTSTPASSTLAETSTPKPPTNLTVTSISSTQNDLSWSPPTSDGNSPITGYKIEVKKDTGSYSNLAEDTKSTSTTFSHVDLVKNSKYTYKVSAINSVGVSIASSEASPTSSIEISPISTLTIDEGKLLSFTVKLTDNSLNGESFSLEQNPPSGAQINPSSGLFTWTPTESQGAKSYVFDVVAKLNSMTDRQLITITVNDVLKIPDPVKEPDPIKEPDPVKEPEPVKEPGEELGIASFVDPKKDPQSYVDRYNNEPTYKKWFDENFPEYSSIHQAVGLDEPQELAPFVDPKKNPQSYVDRYNNEPTYKKWFDENFPEYSSIHQAVGLDEPEIKMPEFGKCGVGTKLIDGVCTVIDTPKSKPWWKFW